MGRRGERRASLKLVAGNAERRSCKEQMECCLPPGAGTVVSKVERDGNHPNLTHGGALAQARSWLHDSPVRTPRVPRTKGPGPKSNNAPFYRHTFTLAELVA